MNLGGRKMTARNIIRFTNLPKPAGGSEPLRGKIEKLKARLKNREYRYLVKRILPAGNMFLYSGIQLVFRLSDVDRFDQMYKLVKKRCDHEFKIATGETLKLLYDEFPEDAEKFKRRIARGNRCYVTMKDGEITGHIWALEATERFNTNSLWRLKPDTMDGAWCFDGFVRPEYRMRGLFVYLMGGVRKDLLSQGYVTQYGETDNRNMSSLNTHLRVGYKIFWRVPFISILGLKIYFPRNPETGDRRVDFRYALRIDRHKL